MPTNPLSEGRLSTIHAFVVAHQGFLLNILFVVGAVCFVLGESFLGKLAGLNPALARRDTIPAGVLIGTTSALFLGGSFYVLDRFSGGAYVASVRDALHWSDLNSIVLAVGYGVLAGFLPMLVRGFVRVAVGDRLDAVSAARGDDLRRVANAGARLGYIFLILLPLLWLPGTFVTFALVDHVRVLLNWFGGHEAPIWLLIVLAFLVGVFRILSAGSARQLNGGYTTREERQAYMKRLFDENFFDATLVYIMLVVTYIPWIFSLLVSLAALGYLVWLSGVLLLIVFIATVLIGQIHNVLVRAIAQASPQVLFAVFSICGGLTIFMGRYVLDPGLLPTFLP